MMVPDYIYAVKVGMIRKMFVAGLFYTLKICLGNRKIAAGVLKGAACGLLLMAGLLQWSWKPLQSSLRGLISL